MLPIADTDTLESDFKNKLLSFRQEVTSKLNVRPSYVLQAVDVDATSNNGNNSKIHGITTHPSIGNTHHHIDDTSKNESIQTRRKTRNLTEGRINVLKRSPATSFAHKKSNNIVEDGNSQPGLINKAVRKGSPGVKKSSYKILTKDDILMTATVTKKILLLGSNQRKDIPSSLSNSQCDSPDNNSQSTCIASSVDPATTNSSPSSNLKEANDNFSPKVSSWVYEGDVECDKDDQFKVTERDNSLPRAAIRSTPRKFEKSGYNKFRIPTKAKLNDTVHK